MRLAVIDASPVGGGPVTHALTHRRYEFEVYTCRTDDERLAPALPPRRWTTLEKLSEFPLPRPHLKIVEMLGNKGP